MRKTSIARLCAEVAGFNPEFIEKAKRRSLLDGYYIPTRYPNGLPDGIPSEVYNQEAADGAVKLAEESIAYVFELIETL